MTFTYFQGVTNNVGCSVRHACNMTRNIFHILAAVDKGNETCKDHFEMPETLTLKQLVQHVAPVYFTQAELKTLARQIQHWTVCGLFDQAGVSIPDKHVGRGRSRRYPKNAIFWCAFFRAMSRYGMAPDEMANTLRDILPRAADVKRAMEGDGLDVVVLREDMAIHQDPLMVGYSLRVDTDPISVSSKGNLAGRFFNLTEIFKAVRP